MYLSHLNMGRKNSLHTKEINFDPKKTFPFLRITLSEKEKYDEIYIVAIEMLLGIAYGLLNVGAWNKILKHVVTELQTNRFDIATDFIDQVVHPIKKSVGSTFKEKLTFISECGLLLLLPRLLSLLCCGCCCGVGVLWREGPWATHGLSVAHPHSAELQHAARTRPLHITAGVTHIRITGFGSSMSGLGAEAITGHDHSYCHDFRDYHPCIS